MLNRVARGVLFAGFAFTGTLKLLSFRAVDSHPAEFSWITPLREAHLSVPLGALELMLAFAVLTQRLKVAGLASFVASSLFAVALSIVILSGLPTGACGCFGTWQAPIFAHYAIIFSLLLASRRIVCS
jgi:hypothetical protein